MIRAECARVADGLWGVAFVVGGGWLLVNQLGGQLVEHRGQMLVVTAPSVVWMVGVPLLVQWKVPHQGYRDALLVCAALILVVGHPWWRFSTADEMRRNSWVPPAGIAIGLRSLLRSVRIRRPTAPEHTRAEAGADPQRTD